MVFSNLGFRAQRFIGSEVHGSKVQRFKGSGFKGSGFWVHRFRAIPFGISDFGFWIYKNHEA
jgi:hypothetical protein